ncbi:MAG: beta-N-acetylhexosaminidase [Burkholderiales bacterium]|nr:beta-N-acetylhexosaminidase [Burkholderiales bacterium]
MRRLRARLARGVVVLDPLGPTLTADDRRRLMHPAVGGVILFAHNYESPQQLAALTAEIAALREPPLLLCTDHEGGRVQRFRDGFTPIPAMRRLGTLWDRDRDAARACARAIGYVIGAELGARGIDFSLAPVLDLDYGTSAVIGERALHYDPNAVGALAVAMIQGLAEAGMAALGKHFPGHGFAAADSHVAVPRDERPTADIMRRDVAPYAAAIAAGLAAVMPAHIVYPRADSAPAGYSRFWLQEVLRARLGFDGLVLSDDLGMAGAGTAGDVAARARAALAAGCDMVLLCRDPSAQDGLLAALGELPMAHPRRAERMRRKGGADRRRRIAYREALAALERIP